MSKELKWIEKARNYLGLKEVKGSKHAPEIIAMLDKLGSYNKEARAWWRDDEVPWCGVFVGYVLGESGRYVVKEWYRAKEWASPTMTKLSNPVYGAIAVLDRAGGGHVGFVVGVDRKGNIMLLGGNQNDSVSIAPFNRNRITSYYWPSKVSNNEPVKSIPYDFRYDLPILASNGKPSTLS